MKVYLISQGKLPLMNLRAVIDTVAVYHKKENISWMLLHSFYHARIVSHENTGKVRFKEESVTKLIDIDVSMHSLIILIWFNPRVSRFLHTRNYSVCRIFVLLNTRQIPLKSEFRMWEEFEKNISVKYLCQTSLVCFSPILCFCGLATSYLCQMSGLQPRF